jgi:hypothetical protein
MKNKTLKSNSHFEAKTKPVEMITYFEGGKDDHRSFWANFKMENIIFFKKYYSEHASKYEGYRSELYNMIMKLSLDPNPNAGFYSLIMTYLCGNEIIQNGIKDYPQGGMGIIGHINVLDESQSTFQFVDPETFKNQLKKDFSIIPFTKNEANLTLEELIFLTLLVEMVKSNFHQPCYLSNEEILRFCPIPNISKVWISETLGKLIYSNIIDVFVYKTNGKDWFRDIFIMDFERSNHIQFSIDTKFSA